MTSITRDRVSIRSPDQSLAVKDVTRQDVLDQVNNFSEVSPTLGKATDYLKSDQVSSKNILSSITDSLVPTGSGLNIDQGALRTRLTDSLGVGNLVSGLSTSALGELATSMGAQDGEGLVKALLDGGTQITDTLINLDTGSANSIAEAITRITGDNGLLSFLDIGAELGTISYLTNKLREFGALDAIDSLLAKIKDEKDLNAMLEDLALNAARSSDLPACRHFVEKMGSHRAYAMRDNLCTAIVSSYEIDTESNATISERCNEITSLLTLIYPSWLVDAKHPNFKSLEYFSKANADATTVLQSNDSLRYLAAAGSITPISTPEEINQLAFPQVGTW